MATLVRPEQRIIVLGVGGTASLLTLCALHQSLGSKGETIAIENSERALKDIAALGIANIAIKGDATHPLELVEQVRAASKDNDYQADLTVNVVNVPMTKVDSRILFFSMATSFTTAALGAEGIAHQVEMHIGNGYMPDHTA